MFMVSICLVICLPVAKYIFITMQFINVIEVYNDMFDIKNEICSCTSFTGVLRRMIYIMFYRKNPLKCILVMLHYVKSIEVDVHY